ncbi:hypothetical protein GCM10007938_35810 [Vibrio zhanjiangensis]|uniref:TyeA family type III secretion system gatekeeper subunit n=1 Tax=Vibrio zhanjiangensis TaxID=1046128 RepID=A0ABQ6F2R2_9VIBR|nr:TyeA family type III secretion system gatekeeper subunit [Vibrio zhanjiangensis]GLT19798.1 hypothetical protein GCM10007938_35810 [Vibrio zhanjiangensis]
MSGNVINTALNPGIMAQGISENGAISKVKASPQSSLASSLEELGSAIADRRNRSKDETKANQRADRDQLKFIEEIQEYLQQVPDLEKQKKLLSFVSANLGKSKTADEFLLCLESFSDDEGLQYLAGKVLAESSDPNDKRHFNKALDTFFQQHQKSISITLNTSAAFAEQLPVEDISQARSEYRTLTEYQAHSKAWQDLQIMAKDYGSIEKAIDIHQKALSADYHSLKPSDDRSVLGQVMLNLGQLKQLTTVFELVESVAKLIEKLCFVPIDSSSLMDHLLTFADSQYVGQSRFDNSMRDMGITLPNAKVVAAQQMRRIAMALPEGMYPTLEHRVRVTTSLQDCIDQAINKEEEWLDAQ